MGEVSKNTLRIVVADDEVQLVRYYERMIPLLGYQVVGVARSCAELQQRCADAGPNLIVTDIDMPDGSGLEVAVTSRLPFILVAGRDEPDGLRNRIQGRGLIAYLIKPIKREDLSAALRLAADRLT